MSRTTAATIAIITAGVILAAALAAPAQQQPGAYLPIVLKPGTPTLLDNGDFEQGTLHWSDPGGFITDAVPAGIAAHSGTHLAWLHATAGAQFTRNLQVPADKPVLSYWIWIRSTEPTCGDDIGGVGFSGVSPPAVDTFDLCADTATNGWVNRTVDLSAAAGQSVGTLIFSIGAFDESVATSDLFIDDVGFQAR